MRYTVFRFQCTSGRAIWPHISLWLMPSPWEPIQMRQNVGDVPTPSGSLLNRLLLEQFAKQQLFCSRAEPSVQRAATCVCCRGLACPLAAHGGWPTASEHNHLSSQRHTADVRSDNDLSGIPAGAGCQPGHVQRCTSVGECGG